MGENQGHELSAIEAIDTVKNIAGVSGGHYSNAGVYGLSQYRQHAPHKHNLESMPIQREGRAMHCPRMYCVGVILPSRSRRSGSLCFRAVVFGVCSAGRRCSGACPFRSFGLAAAGDCPRVSWLNSALMSFSRHPPQSTEAQLPVLAGGPGGGEEEDDEVFDDKVTQDHLR